MAQLFLLMRGWQRWGVVATLAAAACTRPQLHPHRHADGEATLHPAPDGPQPEPIDEPLRALKAPTQYVGLGMAYGGDGRMRASELAMLPDGSTLVVGSFSMPVHFDSGTLPLEPKGPRDGFVMKLDSERRILAARSFGGPGRDGLFRVAP